MSAPSLRLRDARPSDVELLFRWANDPLVRSMSFSSAPIPWEGHQFWFAAKLADPACLLFLAEDESDTPVALVRFDVEGERAVISVSVAPEARGRGLGAHAIHLGTVEARARARVGEVLAYIKPENEASIRAFRSAGFGEPFAVDYAGHEAVCMRRSS